MVYGGLFSDFWEILGLDFMFKKSPEQMAFSIQIGTKISLKNTLLPPIFLLDSNNPY